jgi:hypothetical protein
MESKSSLDIEIQVPESDISKEICEQTDAVTDDWDAPDNKENPRNWSAGESWSCRHVLRAALMHSQ